MIPALDHDQPMIPYDVRVKVVEMLMDRDPSAWTIQGLGMMRAMVTPDKTWRLHIWDSSIVYDPRPSQLHTHPWDFYSFILSGCMKQRRYLEGILDETTYLYMKKQIMCGMGACTISEAEEVVLAQCREEIYTTGDFYFMSKDEVHESYPLDATVTLIQRKFYEDTEKALVYYQTTEWISAEPRPVDEDTFNVVINRAVAQLMLNGMFGEGG